MPRRAGRGPERSNDDRTELYVERYKLTGQDASKKNAIVLYRKVLEDFPAYERNDEVLFFLGLQESSPRSSPKRPRGSRSSDT